MGSSLARQAVKTIKIQPDVNILGSDPWKLVRCLAVNSVIALVFLLGMTAQVVFSRGTQGFRFEGDPHKWSLPSKQEQVICFVLGVLWNEVMFYYSHRIMHHKSLYGKFHKQHHEYTAPFALAAIYSTPVEMLVSDLWPFLGIVSIYRFHIFFSYCWVANAIMGTQTHHSGHRWPWMSDVDAQPHVHDLPHQLFNVNFGNVGLLDKLHG